ncbi:hypothetical protein H920_06752 [Fukomys damarensis]|uniref:Uncharacterized protein n=1 Tax=Fukomys damarensis TaxID=885580 RepID=A0A091E9I0_FUKDA|nr:hypothetical protein H920_06752 [Fukomys damarensis]
MGPWGCDAGFLGRPVVCLGTRLENSSSEWDISEVMWLCAQEDPVSRVSASALAFAFDAAKLGSPGLCSATSQGAPALD